MLENYAMYEIYKLCFQDIGLRDWDKTINHYLATLLIKDLFSFKIYQ